MAERTKRFDVEVMLRLVAEVVVILMSAVIAKVLTTEARQTVRVGQCTFPDCVTHPMPSLLS